MKCFKILMIILLLLPVLSLPSQEAPEKFQMTEIWYALADTQGNLNKERGTASCEAAEFSPDAELIIAGSKGRMVGDTRKGQRVSLWNREGELLWERERADEVEAVAFAPDNRTAAAGGEDKLVEIYRITAGEDGTAVELVESLKHPHGIDSLRFSPDGRLLATGDEGRTIRLYDTATWKEVADAHHEGGRPEGDAINQLDFTSDSRKLVSAGGNGQVRIWNVLADQGLEGVERARMSVHKVLEGHEGSVKSVRISPDDKYIAAGAGSGQGVRLWDFDGEPVGHIRATGWIMETVEWRPCGGLLLTGGNEGEEDDENGPWTFKKEETGGIGNVRAYRLPDILAGKTAPQTTEKTPEPGPGVDELPGVPVIPLHSEPLYRQEYLHFNFDCTRLVTAHEDGTLRVFGVVMH